MLPLAAMPNWPSGVSSFAMGSACSSMKHLPMMRLQAVPIPIGLSFSGLVGSLWSTTNQLEEMAEWSESGTSELTMAAVTDAKDWKLGQQSGSASRGCQSAKSFSGSGKSPFGPAAVPLWICFSV